MRLSKQNNEAAARNALWEKYHKQCGALSKQMRKAATRFAEKRHGKAMRDAMEALPDGFLHQRNRVSFVYDHHYDDGVINERAIMQPRMDLTQTSIVYHDSSSHYFALDMHLPFLASEMKGWDQVRIKLADSDVAALKQMRSDMKALYDAYHSDYASLLAALGSCRTLAQLKDRYPKLAELYPAPAVKKEYLPAITNDKINSILSGAAARG